MWICAFEAATKHNLINMPFGKDFFTYYHIISLYSHNLNRPPCIFHHLQHIVLPNSFFRCIT